MILLAAISIVNAHMLLQSPAPRAGTASDPATVVCQGKPAAAPVMSVKAGSTMAVKISGGAPHGGGSCLFSLACGSELSDPTNPKFKTIYVTDKNCPLTTDFNIPIPQEANGNCVLSWAWVPILAGQPEMYQNCADISVTGGSGSSLKGPSLSYFNTLNKAGTRLYGDNAQNARTLFEESFGLSKVVSLPESESIAKQKNFGINAQSAGDKVVPITSTIGSIVVPTGKSSTTPLQINIMSTLLMLGILSCLHL